MFLNFISTLSVHVHDKCSHFSNKELAKNLNEISNKSGECQSAMVKLKTQHGAAKKMLKDVESKVVTLDAQNKALIEKNTGLNVSLQWAVKQYQESLNRLKDVEKKCDMEKSSAFEQCYEIINDNKKKQWCSTCQKEGGRYYCSRKCEEKYWYVESMVFIGRFVRIKIDFEIVVFFRSISIYCRRQNRK